MDESQNSAVRVAHRHVQKTAGEVRFIKDRGGDHSEWAWNPPGASERTIDPTYQFDARQLEPVARTLRSCLMALGHIQTARSTFTRIKSQRVSPDGNLGGKGYVMPVKDIRKQLSNCDEALSSITDCLYDELQAPHWKPQALESPDPRQRPELRNIMDDVDEIRDDPEDWAQGEEAEEDKDGGQAMGKTASWGDYGDYGDDRYDDYDGPRNESRRQRAIREMAEEAECEDRDKKELKREFQRAVYPLYRKIVDGLSAEGVTVKPLVESVDYTEDRGRGWYEYSIEFPRLPAHYVTVEFGGELSEGESEVSIQYDVDDFDDRIVKVECPPEEPTLLRVSGSLFKGRRLPEWRANAQGVASAVAAIVEALPKGVRLAAADRVASRYLARRNG